MSNFFLRYLAVFLITVVTACSYKPIFSENNYNFEINEIIFSGERYINRIIKNMPLSGRKKSKKKSKRKSKKRKKSKRRNKSKRKI